ncbi:ABC transporter substrate-binding protein [Blautia schinkii]|nr:ABC transporter substrate-binding protein [Blautia schinkii]
MTGKKSARVLAACLAGVFLLGGCGDRNVVSYQPAAEEVTTLHFFGNKYEPENVVVIEEIISGFMKEHPDIRVSYESLKGNDYYTALAKRMEAGKGDDVFMVNHDTLLELEEKGMVADLSELDTIDNYTDAMMSQMEENGKIYWLPTTVSVFGLYCNNELLKEHKQSIPNNLKEWENVCRYFEGEGIVPIIVNNDISLKTLAIGRGFYSVYQEGRQYEVFEDINAGKDKLSSYLEPGFAVVEDFINKGYVDAQTGLNTNKTSDDLEEFAKGESPFMLTGAWAAGRVESMAPELDFQVVPLPVLEDDNLIVINADVRLSVNAKSPHLEEAEEFIEYFTQAENIGKLVQQQSSFSPLKGGTPSTIKEIQPLLSCYQENRNVIGSDELLKLPIWSLTADISKQLLSGEPLAVCMEWLDEQCEQERGTL